MGRAVPHGQRRAFYQYAIGVAKRRYVVRSYSGSMAMFASIGKGEFQQARWSRVARGGLTMFEIPAGHAEMVLPPYSVMLAACFDECLERVSH
jgi:hypothetical protein